MPGIQKINFPFAEPTWWCCSFHLPGNTKYLKKGSKYQFKQVGSWEIRDSPPKLKIPVGRLQVFVGFILREFC